MAPSVSCPNSISSSRISMLGTTAVAMMGSRMSLPPRTLSTSTVSSCMGRSRRTCTSRSRRESGLTRPRMGETVTPSGRPSTWKTAAFLPLFWTVTERSSGRPTARTPMSSFDEDFFSMTKARFASGAWPVQRSCWSLPSSVFSTRTFSSSAPLGGGVKTISHWHEPPGRITPDIGLTAKEVFALAQEKRAGALPELDSFTVSEVVRSMLSSGKRKLISARDILIMTGVISALTRSLKEWMPLIW
mmetsp:Transcript_45041/g.133338  ORF Transcript_45041/g.133338 Transcript_45041/m.133338 type:complete len:245 (-) Transcript_45041:282-1016(-)